MRKDRKLTIISVILPVIILLIIVAALYTSLGSVKGEVAGEDRQRLEDSVRRAAVACYAAEGFYPPDLDYIADHYGVILDDERYSVVYEVFAKNIMPDITVIDKLAAEPEL